MGEQLAMGGAFKYGRVAGDAFKHGKAVWGSFEHGKAVCGSFEQNVLNGMRHVLDSIWEYIVGPVFKGLHMTVCCQTSSWSESNMAILQKSDHPPTSGGAQLVHSCSYPCMLLEVLTVQKKQWNLWSHP